MKNFLLKILNFFKTNCIFSIALVIAIVSMFFVPPDKEYIDYFEWSTLANIFLLLLVIAALSNINFFEKLARLIVKMFKNTRSIIICLIFMTYVSAIFNANDMSLLTLLPLSYVVLKYTNNLRYCAFTFIMQNIASNLGGMLVPIGNPQNLYIFSFYEMSLLEFLKIMILPTLIAFVLILTVCMFIKKDKLEFQDDYDKKIDKRSLIILLVLFVLVLLSVLRVIPYWVSLILVTVAMIFVDRKAFLGVDYTIPLIFFVFFIFSGNLSRIPAITNFLTKIIDKHTFFTAYFSCQVISNVPTAILLSKFTNNYAQLLISVNVASLGIIFSSLSGIIALKEYVKVARKEGFDKKHGTWFYVGLDTLFNVVGALILVPASYFIAMLF
ncbi:MAG: citrate transporter [Clostridia bacterium]|nr:citrate transporter [Clostridia bacterium]